MTKLVDIDANGDVRKKKLDGAVNDRIFDEEGSRLTTRTAKHIT